MKGYDVRLRFKVMRAQGKSLNVCAEELNAVRQTLSNWEKEHEEEIQHLRAVKLDALAEAYWMKAQGRIELNGESLRRVKEELERRDLSEVPTAKLVELKLKLINELRKEPLTISVKSKEQIEQAILLRDEHDSTLNIYNPAPKRRAP